MAKILLIGKVEKAINNKKKIKIVIVLNLFTL